MQKNKLQIQQLDAKIQRLSGLKEIQMPAGGWIKAIRTAIGMSLVQMGKRLNITKQSVLEIEQREKDSSITLKTLIEVASALDMQLVYGFIPNDGSLEAMIEKKAKELATRIVKRTSHSMMLEDQANSQRRLQQAIQERTEELKKELPKILWD